MRYIEKEAKKAFFFLPSPLLRSGLLRKVCCDSASPPSQAFGSRRRSLGSRWPTRRFGFGAAKQALHHEASRRRGQKRKGRTNNKED
mmetsp:Transcript_1323/g.3246  ORF Transcript_1323/g.3246 Transcript_1323/m.3246 type:complete len:87 (-) Transcript_1323:590-850(-)